MYANRVGEQWGNDRIIHCCTHHIRGATAPTNTWETAPNTHEMNAEVAVNPAENNAPRRPIKTMLPLLRVLLLSVRCMIQPLLFAVGCLFFARAGLSLSLSLSPSLFFTSRVHVSCKFDSYCRSVHCPPYCYVFLTPVPAAAVREVVLLYVPARVRLVLKSRYGAPVAVTSLLAVSSISNDTMFCMWPRRSTFQLHVTACYEHSSPASNSHIGNTIGRPK